MESVCGDVRGVCVCVCGVGRHTRVCTSYT